MSRYLYISDSDSDSDSDDGVDVEIREKISKDKCKDEWKDAYEGVDALMNTKCVYLSLTIIRNAMMNECEDGGDEDCIELAEFAAVFKFGHCEVPKSSVYKRMEAQFNELGSVYSVPILIMRGNNVHSVEQIMREQLNEYKLQIACSNKKIPREFYCLTEKIVDIVYHIGIDSDLELLVNNLGDDPIDSLLPENIIRSVYGDESEIQILDDTSNNLTSLQRRIIRQT